MGAAPVEHLDTGNMKGVGECVCVVGCWGCSRAWGLEREGSRELPSPAQPSQLGDATQGTQAFPLSPSRPCGG